MKTDSANAGIEDQGATVVITHRLREDKHADYERWLEEIAPLCKASPGHLDWHIIRPIAGLTETYTVVIRFDTRAHLQQWMESPDRSRLIEKVQALFVKGDAGGRKSEGAGALEAVPGDVVCHLPAGTRRPVGGRARASHAWRPGKRRVGDTGGHRRRRFPDGLSGHAALHEARSALAVQLSAGRAYGLSPS